MFPISHAIKERKRERKRERPHSPMQPPNLVQPSVAAQKGGGGAEGIQCVEFPE